MIRSKKVTTERKIKGEESVTDGSVDFDEQCDTLTHGARRGMKRPPPGREEAPGQNHRQRIV